MGNVPLKVEGILSDRAQKRFGLESWGVYTVKIRI